MTSVKNELMMQELGERFGSRLKGGEVIELIGDVGAGKTTFVKGVGRGLGIDDDVQSPSFTISRVYEARDGLRLCHYDFYRLTDAGVMSYELAESMRESQTITIIEWADTVASVLPENRVTIRIRYMPDDTSRNVEMSVPSTISYLETV